MPYLEIVAILAEPIACYFCYDLKKPYFDYTKRMHLRSGMLIKWNGMSKLELEPIIRPKTDDLYCFKWLTPPQVICTTVNAQKVVICKYYMWPL